jgi:hypothetical protein
MNKITCPDCGQTVVERAYKVRHKGSAWCKHQQEKRKKKDPKEKSYC